MSRQQKRNNKKKKPVTVRSSRQGNQLGTRDLLDILVHEQVPDEVAREISTALHYDSDRVYDAFVAIAYPETGQTSRKDVVSAVLAAARGVTADKEPIEHIAFPDPHPLEDPFRAMTDFGNADAKPAPDGCRVSLDEQTSLISTGQLDADAAGEGLHSPLLKLNAFGRMHPQARALFRRRWGTSLSHALASVQDESVTWFCCACGASARAASVQRCTAMLGRQHLAMQFGLAEPDGAHCTVVDGWRLDEDEALRADLEARYPDLMRAYRAGPPTPGFEFLACASCGQTSWVSTESI